MLKRLIVVFFVIAYLVPAIGFSVDVHWCGKTVRVVDLNASHHTKCPCKTNMPKGCCKDKHLLVKLTDEYRNLACVDFLKSFTTFNALASVFIQTITPTTPTLVFDFSRYHAPPFKSKESIYLRNRIFRI